MPAPTTPLTGDPLLMGVTDAMVALHQRYHHRKPVTARTTLLGDDLLACVLGGVDTDVEKTQIELECTTTVQETRSASQDAMQHTFIAAVEQLSGRDVLAFISNHHVGPDTEIELFLLKPVPTETGGKTAGLQTTSETLTRDAEARTLLETDQTAADLDQTQADFDQAESDADQGASDADQELADRDQGASDRDQVLADREHARLPAAAATDEAYETSRLERQASSWERGSTAAVRSRTSGERFASAARRDDIARARDLNAAARDRAAQAREAAAEARDAAADTRAAPPDDPIARRRTFRLVGATRPSVPEPDCGGD
jgi:uncharacterized protein YbcI